MMNKIQNWQEIKLGDLCKIVNGKTPLRSNDSYWMNGNINWFTIDDLRSQGRFISHTIQHITDIALKETGIKLVPKDSVLICCTASVGEVAYTLIETATNQQFNSLIPNDNSTLSPRYLYYAVDFISPELKRQMGTTTFGFVSTSKLSDLKIKLPQIKIQQKIAYILFTLDEAIRKTNQIIQKNEVLKQGLMRNLLAKKEWRLQKISSISKKIQYGFTTKSINENTGIRLLRITDIQDQMVNWNTVPFCKCPANLLNDYLLKEGDILFARTGATTGKTFQVTGNHQAIFASYLIRIRVDLTKADNQFIYQFFQSDLYWKQIQRGQSGSAQGGFNASKLGEILIHLPSIQEQKSISEMLSRLDIKNKLEITKQQKLLLLKNGLMQDIFSQKVIVN